jgi:hypothetical protein
MIDVGIQNIVSVNVREAIMNFCFFFNAIGQKVISEEALKSKSTKFKNIVECVLVGEVGLNFYTILDEAN